jgi:hypothetical protein
VFFAGFQLVTRIITAREDHLATLFYTSGGGALLLTLAMPFFWQWPAWEMWAWMALSGAIGAGAHFLMINAFAVTEAALLAPFNYSRIFWAVLIGWFADYHEDRQSVVTIDSLGRSFEPSGTAQIRCQEQIGTQTVTLRAVDDASPPNHATTVVRLVVTENPPELVELLATAAPTPTSSCAPGERLRIVWRAVGGVPPYHVSLPGDPDATMVGDRIETVCPTEAGGQWIAVDVGDSNFRPVTIEAQVWIEVVPAKGEP